MLLKYEAYSGPYLQSGDKEKSKPRLFIHLPTIQKKKGSVEIYCG